MNAFVFNALIDKHLLNLSQHCRRPCQDRFCVRSCGEMLVQDHVNVSGFAAPGIARLRVGECWNIDEVLSAACPITKLIVEK
jgi:hypothetical protein